MALGPIPCDRKSADLSACERGQSLFAFPSSLSFSFRFDFASCRIGGEAPLLSPQKRPGGGPGGRGGGLANFSSASRGFRKSLWPWVQHLTPRASSKVLQSFRRTFWSFPRAPRRRPDALQTKIFRDLGGQHGAMLAPNRNKNLCLC